MSTKNLNNDAILLKEYRKEYKKNNTDKRKNLLEKEILSLYQNKIIPEPIFRNIFSEDILDIEFDELLKKYKCFTRSYLDLIHEFDQVRKPINDYMISINFKKNIFTSNLINQNRIAISRKFVLCEKYLMNYFGINKIELLPLMKRRGLVEKFAVYRLNVVLNDIYNKINNINNADIGYSLVYYDKDIKTFAINFDFYVNIEIAKKMEEMKRIIAEIQKETKKIETLFYLKLGKEYFDDDIVINDTLNMEIKDYKPKKNNIKVSAKECLNKISEKENLQESKHIVDKNKENTNKSSGATTNPGAKGEDNNKGDEVEVKKESKKEEEEKKEPPKKEDNDEQKDDLSPPNIDNNEADLHLYGLGKAETNDKDAI